MILILAITKTFDKVYASNLVCKVIISLFILKKTLENRMFLRFFFFLAENQFLPSLGYSICRA